MTFFLIPFYYVFPEVAADETRTITLLQPQEGVPRGSYGLLEFYCPDPNCDCRRVMLNIAEEKHPNQFLASIGYGFDRESDMAGPYLDPLHQHSPYARQLMKLVNTLALDNPAYVARLARHYAMIKQAASDPRHPAHHKLEELEATSPERAPSVAPPRLPRPLADRNAPCPCGSGKKYKHCCMKTRTRP